VSPAHGPSRARRPPSRHPRRTVGPPVELAYREGVAWITLARPTTGNRLDAELLGALAEACEAVDDAEEAHVAVLAARGPTFSTGLPRTHPWLPDGWPDAVAVLGALSKPMIAALQGPVLGWGLAVALACDVRIAAADAVLGLPEVAEGRFPGGGSTQRLARIVGVARALELVLLGPRLSAAEAAAWGLVAAVVPPARLATTVAEAARRLAARGPLALRLAKEAVVRALDLPLDDGMRLEHDLYVLLQTTHDRREGIRAFLARRVPRFSGR